MRASSRVDQQMKVEMSQIRRMKAVTLWFLDDKKWFCWLKNETEMLM